MALDPRCRLEPELRSRNTGSRVPEASPGDGSGAGSGTTPGGEPAPEPAPEMGWLRSRLREPQLVEREKSHSEIEKLRGTRVSAWKLRSQLRSHPFSLRSGSTPLRGPPAPEPMAPVDHTADLSV